MQESMYALFFGCSTIFGYGAITFGFKQSLTHHMHKEIMWIHSFKLSVPIDFYIKKELSVPLSIKFLFFLKKGQV